MIPWSNEESNFSKLELDCLLPSGILIQLTVNRNDQIFSIKQKLKEEIRKYPVNFLKDDINHYIFEIVDENSCVVQITDEKKKLSDVRPFFSVLKLKKQQKQQDKQNDGKINTTLSKLIGIGIDELEGTQNEEMREFRGKMQIMCKKINDSNNSLNKMEKMQIHYPSEICNNNMTKNTLEKLAINQNQIFILICISTQAREDVLTFKVLHDINPLNFIKIIYNKIGNISGDKPSHVLKVPGRQEYIIGHHPLSSFKYIRRLILREKNPVLYLQDINSVKIPKTVEIKKGLKAPPPLPPLPHTPLPSLSVFSIKDNYSITLITAFNIRQLNISSVAVSAGIYHGGENMCGSRVFNEKKVENNSCNFDEKVIFDIEVRNIPRMSRLCFLLFSYKNVKKDISKKNFKKKPGQNIKQLGWVNIPIFDFRGMLRTGKQKLTMWEVSEDDVFNYDYLNPIGTVEANPSCELSPSIEISFESYSDKNIYFPKFDEVLEVAANDKKPLQQAIEEKKNLSELEKLIYRDPFHVYCEQDKQTIWNLRSECRDHYPDSLPILLSCVKWNDYKEVCQLQIILQIWSEINAEKALELLDYQYADVKVREFAVKQLQKMNDSEIEMYLLQLVQVLKYESYLDCDLIKFLLKRALNNYKIGHNLFWLLRSEMHVASVAVKFGLILEAYCRGSLHSLDDLTKEVELLNNLKQISEHIKACGLPYDRLQMELKNGFEKRSKEIISNLQCPLNPSIKLKLLKIPKCKCMDSKMKPMWMVWENMENTEKDMLFMYKKGDDLRQDMLTLQILNIMDYIWLRNGLDLRMNVYNVMPTWQKEGLIEVVTESATLADIQIEYKDFAVFKSFNKKCIYQWLQEKNPKQEDFERALDVFTLSCAGYTVATFILGVADRHSDNIMIRSNGQLFHIDFGHILGNFKMKMGFKRERCPFVLTSDFLYVIRKGQENASHFEKFSLMCEDAFKILWDHSKFLITLFKMMMNTGIPEVSCFKDIEFLKDTLLPHKSKDEALLNFRQKFREALKNSWKTSINMMIHILAKKQA